MSTVYSTSQALFPGYLLPAIIFVSLVLLSYAPRWYYLLRYKLPPGPVCLPFVGYLRILNTDTGYISCIRLAEKYGNIVSLYVGNKLVVILDDFEFLKDSYNEEEFLNRPDKILEMAHEQPSVVDSNGVLWKGQRRLMATCLRHLTTGNKNFENIIMEHILDVCSSLKASGSQQVQLNKEIELATNNITCSLIYGKKFKVSHPMARLLRKYHAAMEVHLLQNILKHFLPPAAFLMEFTTKVKAARNIQKMMDDAIRKEIEEHQETLKVNEPRDLVDYFLLNMGEPGTKDYCNMPSLFGNVKALLVASSDSVQVALVWFLLLMAEHQDVQKKIQSEIDTVLGREREPRNSDRGQLSYTEAAIWESMRHKNIATWNLMRSASKDTTLGGFDIPEGTVIMHNMSSHFRSPLYFDRPEKFDPTRFLTHGGKEVHVPEYFVPFSYGKRTCLGDKLAISILFLFCTTILQRFDVLPPAGGVNLRQKTHILNVASKPYVCFNCRI